MNINSLLSHNLLCESLKFLAYDSTYNKKINFIFLNEYIGPAFTILTLRFISTISPDFFHFCATSVDTF